MTASRKRRTILRFAGIVSIGLWGAAAAGVALPTATSAAAPAVKKTVAHDFLRVRPGVPKRGTLDCNGFSPVQAKMAPFNCTDIRGFGQVDNQNTWGGRFYDNGHYIGHDEPDVTFLSSRPGSGGDVSWNLTLGTDPAAAPTATSPGHDVVHWFELSPAPWFSMAMCDPGSYPQLPCTPNSDTNAPSCPQAFDCPADAYPGGGSAFMEMQFYPPGNPPWVDSESCDGTHWCAALTIDSLECTYLYASCNLGCEEPINFDFIQTDGQPDPNGPIPDSKTLYMNPGDSISVRMYDASVPGAAGQKAFKVVVVDNTTGVSGSMQASAKNGFVTTNMYDCSQTPFNFEPEYATASRGNIVPWAALQTNISTEFETGHFEPCTSLSKEFAQNPFDPYDQGGAGQTSGTYDQCSGPYETAGGSEGDETGDALCYYAGDTHYNYDGNGGSTDPDQVTGCQDNVYQNGDVDYDGTSYYADWPTGVAATAKLPGSFVESLPTTGGAPYSRLFFQTDAVLSDSACTSTTLSQCKLPLPGPGKFYPYWSEADHSGTCTLEFGNVSSGVNDFGKLAQYGVSQFSELGYPAMEGNILDNTCFPVSSEAYLLAGRSGGVVPAGDSPPLPDVHTPKGAVVGIAGTQHGGGYFAVTRSGAVYTAGDATFHGDLTTLSPPAHVSDIVGIAPTPDDGGYWLVGSDGGLFSFGDARYLGSVPGEGVHVTDVVGMAATPSGNGYWMVGSDGGIFTFGGAHYYGSLPGDGVHTGDIRGMAAPTTGTGYVLVGSDGGVFVFGHGLGYHGSLPSEGISVSDVVGIAATSDDGGYWMAGSDGTVYHFGDARALPGSASSSDLPISSISGLTVDEPL
jgi:hypothetical protein